MRNRLEIDLEQLERNVNIVRTRLPQSCDIIAVVKANAYGHGEERIALRLEDIGITRFAVASFGEAMNIRNAGVKGEIIVLSYVDPCELEQSFENNITLSGISYEYVKEMSRMAAEKNIKIKMHLKLNTGMNRVGFECKSKKDIGLIMSAYELPGIEFTGIFSHFSSADDTGSEAEQYTRLQLARYENVLTQLAARGINPGLRHISNSGAIAKYTQACFDAVRCGALLYGYNTAQDVPLPVEPIGTWKAAVSCVRTLEAGDCVSYSRHFTAKGGEKTASLCVGYADGYKRNLSGKGYVLIKGKKCPILGSICMDQMMVDVTGLDVKQGDEAILLGRELSADALAEAAGTCMHDIISGIGARVERVYKN